MGVMGTLLLAVVLTACQGDAGDSAAARDSAAADPADPASTPVVTTQPDASDTAGSGAMNGAVIADAGSGGDAAPAAAEARDEAPDRQPAGRRAETGSTHAPPPAGMPPRTDTASGASQAPVAEATEQDPAVREILRATARRYEDVRALKASFTQELENTLLGRTVTSAGELFQRQPDRFLMRFSDPAGDIIVSDGDQFWIYLPSSDPKQVIRTRRGAQGLDLRTQFIGDPVQRFEATYHGREDVGGRTAHVLTLVPREPLGYRRLKVWIDATDHLVRRFELTEESGIVRKFRLTGLETNPSLPDALFEFTPPPGTHVVDRG